MKLRLILIGLFIFLSGYKSNAQQVAALSIDSIRKVERQLQLLSDSIMRGSTDPVRKAAISEFNPVILDLLSNPSTFAYNFDSLKTVSKIISPDGRMKIFTWILPSRSEGTYSYYGIVQVKDIHNQTIRTIGLTDSNIDMEDAAKQILKSDTWLGAVYYEILMQKVKGKTYYTILGWKGFDRFVTYKLIEVISLDAWGNIEFGAPIFKTIDNKITNRVLFGYAAEAVMSLKYEKSRRMIVFDHLSPSSPALKGQFRFYGPDFTYDGYSFKKGYWQYKANLELRNSPK